MTAATTPPRRRRRGGGRARPAGAAAEPETIDVPFPEAEPPSAMAMPMPTASYVENLGSARLFLDPAKVTKDLPTWLGNQDGLGERQG